MRILRADQGNEFENWRRNLVLLILDSTFFQTALAFSDVSIISVFIIQATGSTFFAGLLQMLRTAGLYFPQLLSIRVGSAPYKRNIFLKWTIISRLFLVLAVIAAFLLVDINVIVFCFFLSFFFFHTLDGFTIVPWLEYVAKVIPPTKRGSFFGLTQFMGGLGSVLAGFLVSRILDDPNLSFPINYGTLILIELMLLIGGISFLYLLKEKPDPVSEVKKNLLQSLKEIPPIVQGNEIVKRLTIVQLLISFFGMAAPFYSVYALSILKLDESFLGLFLSFLMIGRFAFSFFWAHLCNRGRSKRIIQCTSLMFIASPITALVARMLPYPTDLTNNLMILVFFLSGASTGGVFLGINNYVMEIAEPTQRPILLGFLNSLNIITSILPLLGGVIIEYLSYDLVFFTSAVIVSLGFLLSLYLAEKGTFINEE